MGLVAIVVIAVPLALVLLALLANRFQRPHVYTRAEVADEIEAFLNKTGGPYDWGDFCTFKIEDPHLDRIRARCARLDEEFPPENPGEYCNKAGRAVLLNYVQELRAESG